MQNLGSLSVIEAPAIEPVTLDFIKLSARIDYDIQDDVLQNWIVSGRQLAETQLRRALILQTLEASYDRFPCLRRHGGIEIWNIIDLPMPPLSFLLSVKYYDADNAEHVLYNNKLPVKKITIPEYAAGDDETDPATPATGYANYAALIAGESISLWDRFKIDSAYDTGDSALTTFKGSAVASGDIFINKGTTAVFVENETEDFSEPAGNADWYVDVNREPGRLLYNKDYPSIDLRTIAAVKIRYVAGYGMLPQDVGGGPSSIPGNISNAIALYCRWENENRAGEVTSLPEHFYNLLNPDRIW